MENIVLLSENESVGIPENYECPFLERELWISATGKISPCCAPDNLRESLGDFGNIKYNTLEQVLKSEKYSSLVRDYKKFKVCENCNMRKPIC